LTYETLLLLNFVMMMALVPKHIGVGT